MLADVFHAHDSKAKTAALRLEYSIDFDRAAVQDETIKRDISDDMYSVPSETIFDADAEEIPNVDANTGEVVSE